MNKYEIKPNERLCMTIEEAAEYSLIGENKLRQIIESDNTFDWVMRIGSRVRIKRPQFEEWIKNQYYL